MIAKATTTKDDGLVSSTPRRDALEAWIRGGYVGPLVLPERPHYENPPAWDTERDRRAAVLAMASSGVTAELPFRTVTINGRKMKVPPPPKRRKARP